VADLAIRATGLGKRYRLGRRREAYGSLRESVARAVSSKFWSLGRRLTRGPATGEPPAADHIWALRDVSVDVAQGDVVGLIGRNGAGKSTLLKILGRITEPTEGLVEIRGRVGSLLEIGTGFHSELSGRDNVFLGGAILGMRRAEIVRRFDEIVAFAELERFIDTPVKHYSSGMYVRLAFAVAAYLEPEILLVDEVLAVGDVQFQKKCLGRMGDVAKQGRTVLFVSHNVGAIKALCTGAILLEEGRLAMRGAVDDCVRRYGEGTRAIAIEPTIALADRRRRYPADLVRFTQLTLLDGNGQASRSFRYNEPMIVRARFAAAQRLRVSVEVVLKGASGERIAWFGSAKFQGLWFQAVAGSETEVELHVPRLPLARGRYTMDVGLAITYQWLDYVEDACFFDVEESDPGGTGYGYEQTEGFVHIDHEWMSVATLGAGEAAGVPVR
jgi:homopolymeric O-antigen transport system ATP-binding protein